MHVAVRLCILLLVGFYSHLCSAWLIAKPLSRPSTHLFPVIRSENIDFDFDIGQGGVRLAMESAIQVSGKVTHSPVKATAQLLDLKRYTTLTTVPSDKMERLLQQGGVTVLATGTGKELYKDPGQSTVEEVYLAPKEACKDALAGAASAMQYDEIVVTMLGGDDLQVLEVLEAMEYLVLQMDVKTKCSVHFYSVCHQSVASKQASVTVLGLKTVESNTEEDKPIRTSLERAIESGHVYSRNEKYFTVLEDDVNTAVA